MSINMFTSAHHLAHPHVVHTLTHQQKINCNVNLTCTHMPALQVISPHKVFKSKFWMHFLFTQVSYMSYSPHTCWVTYSNSFLWRIKIIPHNVIISNTSSLRSNLLHSTLFSRYSQVVGCPVTVYSNLLTSACLNNGESQIPLCPPPPQTVGWYDWGGELQVTWALNHPDDPIFFTFPKLS